MGGVCSKMRKMGKPMNIPSLQDTMMQMWDELDQEMFKRLASHFKTSCEKVVERRGELINKFYL